MALVRVFVPTFRRPTLLPRALASLRAQTLTDWICEVHNDDPDDPFPAELVGRLADSRIQLHIHQRNLGALATFNLFYRPTAEPFYTLLEDDNWWEPPFLSTMVHQLAEHSESTLAWCNQRIWREEADGQWRDTHKSVNPPEPTGSPRLVAWGSHRQALGALHANGAMLVRSRSGESFPTPTDIPFAGVESFRERMLPYPLLYVPQPLANFAVTRQTARCGERTRWAAYQTALFSSYVRHARMEDAEWAALLTRLRAQTPPPFTVLIIAGLICPECRPLLRHVRLAEWLRFARSAVSRPSSTWRAARVKQCHPHWWSLLDQHTARRFAESRSA